MSTFQELGVDVALTEVLSGRNISSPFEVQVAAIPLMLDGHDVACCVCPSVTSQPAGRS